MIGRSVLAERPHAGFEPVLVSVNGLLAHGKQSASLITLFEPGAATNGLLAELLRDLIRDSIQFLMTLTVRLIEECQLCIARVTQFTDAKS